MITELVDDFFDKVKKMISKECWVIWNCLSACTTNIDPIQSIARKEAGYSIQYSIIRILPMLE